MLIATEKNFKDFNFELSIESQMDNYRIDKDYTSMKVALKTHMLSIINSIMHFGNDEMAKKFLKNFSELIEFHCLDLNRCLFYYELYRRISIELRNHYSTRRSCISLMIECIDLLDEQEKFEKENS